ncbi:MAG: anhydro-N-acetylmuramic acid kinase [Rhodobiaceae bacterium]|nr:anhydro-N-acetylmuramic acid kinase [Rhodobiaceae bacterium]MCC0056967.1 anhydro-N-acetylmuramic acid kinase [Rhodobiaceae bacterium]
MTERLRVLGMMSGTSMDGIETALIETDGESLIAFGPHESFTFDHQSRELLMAAKASARSVGGSSERTAVMTEAEALVGALHVRALEAFFVHNQMTADDVDLIGFHGQTVFHAPDRGITVQLGDASVIARAFRCETAFDFRSSDVAAGGEGAPLAPVYHRALVARSDLPRPVVVLNLGGVANFTAIDMEGDMIACDTGPANALLDDFVAARTGRPFDESGRLAASGSPDEAVLRKLMDDPYFTAPYPKSLDRDAFDPAPAYSLSDADGAATLTAFSARSIAAGLALLPFRPELIVATGGGARNPHLLRMIGLECRVETIPAERVGWTSQAIEAQCFAYLAARVKYGLPITFPTTTGVPAPLPGGRIVSP